MGPVLWLSRSWNEGDEARNRARWYWKITIIMKSKIRFSSRLTLTGSAISTWALERYSNDSRDTRNKINLISTLLSTFGYLINFMIGFWCIFWINTSYGCFAFKIRLILCRILIVCLHKYGCLYKFLYSWLLLLLSSSTICAILNCIQ